MHLSLINVVAIYLSSAVFDINLIVLFASTFTKHNSLTILFTCWYTAMCSTFYTCANIHIPSKRRPVLYYSPPYLPFFFHAINMLSDILFWYMHYYMFGTIHCFYCCCMYTWTAMHLLKNTCTSHICYHPYLIVNVSILILFMKSSFCIYYYPFSNP